MSYNKVLNPTKSYSLLDSYNSYVENKIGLEKSTVKNNKGLLKFLLSVGYFGALVFSMVKLLT